jgi:hypothetical protein
MCLGEVEEIGALTEARDQAPEKFIQKYGPVFLRHSE